MFTGRQSLSIDEKGRVAVPKVFRQELDGAESKTLYVVPMASVKQKPHIEVYPAAELARLAKVIREMENREFADLLKDQFIGNATAVEFDSQGRITLPQKLREHAGLLNGRAMVVGQDTRFDIWDESILDSAAAPPKALDDALVFLPR